MGEIFQKEVKGDIDHSVDMVVDAAKKSRVEEKGQEDRRKGKYKKIGREQDGKSSVSDGKRVGGKRSNSDMDVDEQGREKKLKGG